VSSIGRFTRRRDPLALGRPPESPPGDQCRDTLAVTQTATIHSHGLRLASSRRRVRKRMATLWKMEPHTAAKHRILQNYLVAWLPIMSKYNRRLVYVDGFAGPGVYEDGEPGSPIIALKAYLDHGHRHLIDAELVYVFIEENAARVRRLKKEVAHLGELPKNVVVEIIEGGFQDRFAEVLDEVDQQGANLAPTFAFIDPFGYSDAPMDLSGRFLQFDRCEVLIYVPLRHVNRFVGRTGQERAMNTLFGTDEWKQARALSGATRLRFLHDLFSDQLKKECGLTYVRSFEIVSSANPASGYTLCFGTKHLLGLEKMKESMWDIDPVEGQRYKDTTSAGMQPLFEQEVDTTLLRDALIDHFGTSPFTIEDACEFTVIETPYIRSHVKKRTLKPLEADGKLEVLTERNRKGTYPDRTRMRFIR
jgi:three-Cys-motif partner protein